MEETLKEAARFWRKRTRITEAAERKLQEARKELSPAAARLVEAMEKEERGEGDGDDE